MEVNKKELKEQEIRTLCTPTKGLGCKRKYA